MGGLIPPSFNSLVEALEFYRTIHFAHIGGESDTMTSGTKENVNERRMHLEPNKQEVVERDSR